MADRLNDRYELGEVLGSGGMGTVYRGRDLRLGRDVAIKVLRGDRVGDDAARARFIAEARTAGMLNHPGIATVHDVGEDATSQAGDPFMVMQLVEGTPLSEVLRHRGAIGADAVERLLGGVAEALAVAHAAGVVHRDVKPGNIVLSTDSRPVLVDFGIAIGASSEPLTETGAVLGTVEYISPEQARGRSATGASDVYSLGLVAYQCLVGESAFRRDTAVAAALAQVSEELPDLPASVPQDLARLVTAMTMKDPDARPTAMQVRDAVEPHTHGATGVLAPLAAGAATQSPETSGSVTTEGVAAVTASTPVGAATAQADDRDGRGAGVLGAVTGGRVFAGIAALAVLVVLLGLAGGVFGSDDEVTVPDVVGQPHDRATDRLESLGAEVRTTSVDDPEATKGDVVSQSPEAGDLLVEDGVITLEVASGKVTVPDDLVGAPVEDATATLEELGFAVETSEQASDQAAGTVLSVDPTGRQEVGTTIALVVAVAPQPVTSGGGGQDPAEPREKKPSEPGKSDKGAGNGKGTSGGKSAGKASKGKGP